MEPDNLQIDSNKAQFLALFLAVIGILLIYFWPADAQYNKMDISSIMIGKDGAWVEFEGKVDKITKKTDGNTVRVCSDGNECVSVYAGNDVQGNFDATSPLALKSDVHVWGEISNVQGNKFVRAKKIEVKR